MRKKKPTDREQKDEPDDEIEQIRLNLIPSTYPKEFKAICNLRSLRKKQDTLDQDTLDHLKLALEEIVSRYRRRFSDEGYFTRIGECIRFATTAADNIQEVSDLLAKLDVTHVENIWCAVDEIENHTLVSAKASGKKQAPKPRKGFAEWTYVEFMKQLSSMIYSMKLLAAALPIATGVSGNTPGRGRPSNPYCEIAREVIELWEFITAENKIGEIKRFAIAKKQVKQGEPDVVASQDSTEFCRLVFHMINPNVKLVEVRTAINNALNDRDLWSQFFESARHSTSKESLLLGYGVWSQKEEEERKVRKRRVRK
jgi:hypothetical protein